MGWGRMMKMDLTDLDFSKESKTKKPLFEKMLQVYEQTRCKGNMLDEDDLDAVSAASGIQMDISCPFSSRECCDCEFYNPINDRCTRHFKK